MPSYAVTTATYGQGNQNWLRSDKGLLTGFTTTLTVSTFVAGTHYPSGYLPSGICIGKITAGGAGLYDNAAADGRQVMVGHLLNDEPIPTGATHVVVTVLWEADVDESKLPSNSGIDSNGKTDVASHIRYS